MEDKMTAVTIKRRAILGVLFTLGFCMAPFHPATLFAAQAEAEESQDIKIAAIQTAVESFHKAVKTGDRESALELLSSDVVVMENGYVETAEKYVSHHLAEDMEFSAAVTSKRNVLQTTVEGNVGWVISTITSKGHFQGEKIDGTDAELMVLQKKKDKWKIRVIHWSS